jgi:hypothetical protein
MAEIPDFVERLYGSGTQTPFAAFLSQPQPEITEFEINFTHQHRATSRTQLRFARESTISGEEGENRVLHRRHTKNDARKRGCI